jgi:hypothetical protein
MIGGHMSGIGVIWGVVRTVATKIPWGRVIENVPAVVDLVERAKDKFSASTQNDLEEKLILLRDENLKLEKALLEISDNQQELANSLKVVLARQKKLAIATVVSLLIATSSLILWVIK